MRSLTSLDSFFLAAEDARTNTNVSALAILDAMRADGTLLTRADLVELVGKRIHLLPPLRWRLVEVPFGIGHPYWADVDVDLDFHIREIALPSPGNADQLNEQVARLANHPMDRSRPLWEIYLISGLECDRVGVLTKFHHAAIDGVSGAEIMGVLFDNTADGRAIAPAPAFKGERLPGQVELLGRGAADALRQPVRAAGAAWRTVTHLDHVATMRGIPGTRGTGKAVRTVARVLTGQSRTLDVRDTPALIAPRTHLNGSLSKRRRFASLSLPLEDVKKLKNAHGTTLNDVVVALCAGALRTWMASSGQLPSTPLVAVIPVSVRSEKQRGTFGNAVGTMVVPIPTTKADAGTRLRDCSRELSAAKERQQAVPVSLMRDSTELVPPIVFGQVTRAITRLASTEGLNPAANIVISNVPGSPVQLYCGGTPIRETYPVSTISDSLGLNITVFSYLDQLNVGLVADRQLVGDLEGLAEALRHELDVLIAAPVSNNVIEGATR